MHGHIYGVDRQDKMNYGELFCELRGLRLIEWTAWNESGVGCMLTRA